MEERICRLPGIRISQLQKLIYERRPKLMLHIKSSTQQISPALLCGDKPYYVHRADTSRATGHCNCLYSKCKCRHNSERSKYDNPKHQYLHRAEIQAPSLIIPKKRLNKHKTQGFDNQQHVSIQRRDKVPTNKNFVLEQYSKSEISNQKIKKKNTYESNKLINQLLEMMKEKYGEDWKKLISQRKVKMLIAEIVKNDMNKIKIQRQTNLKDMQILFSKLQKLIQKEILQKSEEKQISKRKKQHKKLGSSKKQNKIKKSVENQSEKKDADEDLFKIQRYAIPVQEDEVSEQPAFDMMSLILYQDNKKLVQKFASTLINVDMVNFRARTGQIKTVIKQYQNQGRIQTTIRNVLQQVGGRITQEQKNTQYKVIKKQQIDQLIKINTPYEDGQEVNEFKRSKIPLKKSQKTVKLTKTLRDLQTDLQHDSNSQKVLQISLTNCIKSENDQNPKAFFQKSSHKIKQVQVGNFNDQNKTFNYFREKQSHQNQNNKQNISQKLVDNLYITNQKYVFDQKFDFPQFQNSKGKKKNLTLKKRSIIGENRQIQFKSETNDNERIQKLTKPICSQFLIQRNAQIHTMESKYLQQKIIIKQFMNLNKETTQKGIARLKKINLDNLIIDKNDSLFTKKLKIRKLKQIAQGIKGKMIQEILAYIDLYEAQCELIMRKERKIRYSQLLQCFQNQQIPPILVTSEMAEQDLKFIKFSKDYHYGEQQQNQQNYTFKQVYQIRQLNRKMEPNNEKRQIIKCQDTVVRQDGQLIQKQLQFIVSCQRLIPQISQTKNVSNIKSHKKVEGTAQNEARYNEKMKRRKMRGETKFLLTENTMCLDKSSITVQF